MDKSTFANNFNDNRRIKLFPLYLLEDNSNQRKAYATIIRNTIMINELPMNLICETGDSGVLLNFIDQTHEGLFFLDMEIGSHREEGLEIAMKIRQALSRSYIIFITTHEELSLLTLERKVSPFDYIVKEKGFDNIKKNIIDDILQINDFLKKDEYKNNNVFNYHIGNQYFVIPISEIIYLSTSKQTNHRVTLVTKSKVVEFIGNLNDLEKKYSMLFRCDRSFLVNLDQLEYFDNNRRELFFKNGSVVSASIRKSWKLLKILK